MRLRNIPQPKFMHGAAVCGEEIVVTSGISDISNNMGMRMVPMADSSCFSFNINTYKWRSLPDLPIGKLNPTVIVINSRFIFQIGGFDDYDFDIYRLDMRHSDKPWKTIRLDRTIPIINEEVYLKTREYVESNVN